MSKNFLFLENSYMSHYTLQDIENLDNVRIVHWKSVTSNRFLNLLFNIHNSGKISKYIHLPFKSLWYKLVFNKILKTFSPDYIIFTSSWNTNQLIQFFRSKSKNSKLVLRFSDRVSNSYKEQSQSMIQKAKTLYDAIIVYSHEDASEFNCIYHSVGYSKVDNKYLKSCKGYDVVFIGAAKGRIDKIREAYHIFKNAGLSCFFYVTLVPKSERCDDGIIYADNGMSFIDYLSYETAAKCLFELVQEGSTGRTYRLMESIIYNKLLITNCKEIKETPYYNENYVQLIDKVSDINPAFVSQQRGKIEYNYKGEFSPKRFMKFIEDNCN